MVCRNQGRPGSPSGASRSPSTARKEAFSAVRFPFAASCLANTDGCLGRKPVGRSQGSVEVDAQHAGIPGARLRGEQVSLYLPGVGDVVVGQHIGIRHVQRLQTENAGHLLLVDKGRVGIHDEPGVVVKDGVIHAVSTGGTDVGRRNTKVLDKRRVIRTAAQISDPDLATH